MMHSSEFRILFEISILVGFLIGVFITTPLVAAETGSMLVEFVAILLGLAGVAALWGKINELRGNNASG